MHEKPTTDDKQYEKPEITDHGDLTDLTAGLTGGTHSDGTYLVHYGDTLHSISGP